MSWHSRVSGLCSCDGLHHQRSLHTVRSAEYGRTTLTVKESCAAYNRTQYEYEKVGAYACFCPVQLCRYQHLEMTEKLPTDAWIPCTAQSDSNNELEHSYWLKVCAYMRVPFTSPLPAPHSPWVAVLPSASQSNTSCTLQLLTQVGNGPHAQTAGLKPHARTLVPDFLITWFIQCIGYIITHFPDQL